MITACSDRCGWCGRCDDPDDFRPNSRDREYLFCETCGKDAIYPVTVPCLGVFCSERCATVASEKHASVMDQVRR